ncbi:SIRB1 protein, partial [Atlantisia rogersi]|nr:SIRB1 protein [Atlantisia rogersi]
AQEMVQGFKVEQPQGTVKVTAGETITLTCTVSGDRPVIGPVKWLKGWGSGNETVYADKGSFPRVTRAESESNTDFSISISNAQPGDDGIYYCVKFRRTATDDVGEVFQRGKGTKVSLDGSALVPIMVSAAVLLFLLLVFCIVFCMYRRKHRDKAKRPCPDSPAVGNLSPIPKLRETNSTPSSKVLDAETSHQPSQQSSKEDNDIQYADLQLLPQAARHGRSPGAACSEYASIMVAAK